MQKSFLKIVSFIVLNAKSKISKMMLNARGRCKFCWENISAVFLPRKQQFGFALGFAHGGGCSAKTSSDLGFTNIIIIIIAKIKLSNTMVKIFGKT